MLVVKLLSFTLGSLESSKLYVSSTQDNAAPCGQTQNKQGFLKLLKNM